jgi:integrase
MQTLMNFFDEVYRPLRLRGRSGRTTLLHHAAIKQFSKWLSGQGIAAEAQICHLDELLLARYLEARSEYRSPYTVERERSSLMALARLAWERRVTGLDRMPTCPPSVLPDRVPTAWTEQQLQKLWSAALAAPGRIGRIPASLYWPATIRLAYETGERIGALLATPRTDYQRPTLTVQPQARKGGRRGRIYHLSDDLCDLLDAMNSYGYEMLLPWPLTPTYRYRHLQAILQAAGLAEKRLAFHQVRRSAISHIAAAGGDPVAFAGHSNPAVTKRWYLDPRMAERGPAPHQLLPRLDVPPNPAE